MKLFYRRKKQTKKKFYSILGTRPSISDVLCTGIILQANIKLHPFKEVFLLRYDMATDSKSEVRRGIFALGIILPALLCTFEIGKSLG